VTTDRTTEGLADRGRDLPTDRGLDLTRPDRIVNELRTDGTAVPKWSVFPKPAQAGVLRGIWGTGVNDLWIVGDSVTAGLGIISHWNGTAWTNWDRAGRFDAVAGVAGGQVCAVGQSGAKGLVAWLPQEAPGPSPMWARR
jgi:hypothetical protein